ncbi:MAG: TIGR04076 family protein [Candidatus Omnitrophica bacterium]|jgi:uncharacterized repeat protein (TIGR04076 family)|nr:TIGR04076 family protein [Candidatus Omnitrophota bacterium]
MNDLFLDSGDLEAAQKFLRTLDAQKLCPFAAHALYPYVVSFQNGSFFPWRKDKDTVCAQCPNPDSSVSFRVERKTDKIIAVVENLKSPCQAGHKIGDVFQLKLVGDGVGFDACKMNEPGDIRLEILRFSNSCRYYQKPGNVKWSDLSPEGFCLSCYAQGYPDALGLLYQGKNKEFNLSCFRKNDPINFRVFSKEHFLSLPLRLIEKALRLVGFPSDVIDRVVLFRVSVSEKNCPQKLEKGKVSLFNIYNRRKACPAVSYTLFPFLAMAKENIFPYWAEENKILDVHCPDPNADVVYRIRKS